MMITKEVKALKKEDLVSTSEEFTVRYDGFSHMTGEFLFAAGHTGYIKTVFPSHNGHSEDYKFRVVLPISEKVSVIIPQSGREMVKNFHCANPS